MKQCHLQAGLMCEGWGGWHDTAKTDIETPGKKIKTQNPTFFQVRVPGTHIAHGYWISCFLCGVFFAYYSIGFFWK